MAKVFKSHHFVGDRSGNAATLPSFTPGIDQLSLLHERIGETKYRIAYRWKSFAIKETKSHVPKRILGLHFRVPISVYTLSRFAIRDLSTYEHDQYLRIMSKTPDHLHEHFARVFAPFKAGDQVYAINELVLNHDGSVSKMLRSFGPIEDQQFWSDVAKLEQFLLKARIYFFGVGCNNIVVQEEAGGRLVPVLIDYKRIGIRTFWQQFWLFLPFVKKLKLKRRFNKIRHRYDIHITRPD